MAFIAERVPVAKEAKEAYERDASVQAWSGNSQLGQVDAREGNGRDYGLTRTTRTMNPIRCLFQPPTQHTCQSPKREPSVTAVRRRRNLVSNCMCFCGHHMTPSFACHSQVAWRTDRGAFPTCVPRHKSAYAVAHAQNTFPANSPRAEDWLPAGPQRRLRSPLVSIYRRPNHRRRTARKTDRGV